MRTTLLVIAAVAGLVTSADAGVPPSLKPLLDYGQYYKFDAATKEWLYIGAGTIACDKYIREATEAGVAETLTVDVPYDSPDWKAGPHTFLELKAYCKRAKTSEAVASMMTWARIAQNDTVGDIAIKCIESYDALVRDLKFAPTTRLPFEGISEVDPATGDRFVGTLEEARKKLCDPRASKYVEAKAKAEAPYRKALQGDKLEVALGHLETAFYGPGGKELKTPAAMANAKVWFRHTWYDDQPCKQGAAIIHTVTRYQFDGKSKLVKDSAKDHCGTPPRAAYK